METNSTENIIIEALTKSTDIKQVDLIVTETLIENLNETNHEIHNIIDIEPERKPLYENLVMSGGSIRGISLVGAVKELIENNIIDLTKLKAVAGTSAGSLLGLLITLGFTIDEIWDFIYAIDMKKIVNPNFLMILEKCGVETGQIIHNLFEEILTKRTKIKHINFKQLFDITGIHLTIVGSCLTTKEVVYFDHINTPTFKVSMAVRISISIPAFFVPVTIGKKKYIDGSILNNYAMNLFEDRMDKTIGILICNEYATDYRYPEEYLMAVMNLFLFHFFEKTAFQYKENTVYIKETPADVFILDFNVDNQTKLKLFNCGVSASKDFVKNLINKQ